MKIEEVRFDLKNLYICYLCAQRIGFSNVKIKNNKGDCVFMCPECADAMALFVSKQMNRGILSYREILRIINGKINVANDGTPAYRIRTQTEEQYKSDTSRILQVLDIT